jgi:hypothetical protein
MHNAKNIETKDKHVSTFERNSLAVLERLDDGRFH